MINNIFEDDIKNIVAENLAWESFSKKCILVTGANGILPSYMVETFLYLNKQRNLDIKIIGLVRDRQKAENRFKKYLGRNDFELMIHDVSQPFTMKNKIDIIIHAASQASPKFYGIDPVGTLSANILGTYYLLEIARTNQAERFLYFSSGEVYGELKDTEVPTKETMYGYIDPMNVRSCYAESKRMGENMCVSYAHQFGLHTSMVRPFHVYGPGLKLDDGRVFADFVADIVHKRDITMYGSGLAQRAFCYLSDAVVGFFTVLLKGKSAEAYNIGNPDCLLSINDLAEKLKSVFSDKNIKIIRKTRGNQSNYIESRIIKNCPDIGKVIELGWRPKISIEEGFKRTVQSFDDIVSVTSF